MNKENEGVMKLKETIIYMKENASLKEGLNNIYGQVAGGQCAGCLKCCTESVNTFYVEYVDILDFLRSHPQVLQEHAKKISRFFLLEMVEPMYCPFVDDQGRCAIYPVRPLPCRVFGHLEEVDYQENYSAVLESNRALALYFKENHGIDLPESTINRKIEYCKSFVSDQKMRADDRDDLIDLLFSLDSKFLMNDYIDFEDVNQSLITWFLKSVMPIETAGQLRIEGMKLYQEDKLEELDLLVKEISEKILKLNLI
jgi:Fe-S-cluster containining protein